MIVNEALKNLQKLANEGHGELELIYRDCRSGDTGSVDIYDSVKTVDENETMGCLCDETPGTLYVPVYTDH